VGRTRTNRSGKLEVKNEPENRSADRCKKRKKNNGRRLPQEKVGAVIAEYQGGKKIREINGQNVWNGFRAGVMGSANSVRGVEPKTA